MAKFQYPGNLREKHPVITRISILERFNLLDEVVNGNINIEATLGSVQSGASNIADKGTSSDEVQAAKDLGNQVASRQIAGTIEDAIHQVYLYAPSSINFADGLQYDNQDMGLFAQALFSGTEAATGSENSDDFFKNVANVGAAMSTAAVGEVAQRSGVGQQVRLRAGVARNPRTEMLFKTPSLRQMSLTWKLMPTNKQESNTIFEMIKTLRAHSYPSIGSTGQRAAFTFPDVFQVDFVTRRGNDSQMIKFAKAYCTSITTNYGASGPAFFSDTGGEPVEIDLTMTFQETEIQTRESIMEGF